MRKFFSMLNKIEYFIIISSFFVLLIVAFLQVFSRLLIHKPLAWTEEASRYLFIFNVLLASVVVTKRDENFKVDFVYEKFGKNGKKLLDIVGLIIIMLFSLILIVYGLELIRTGGNRISPSLGLSMEIVYLPIPIIGILNFIHIFEKILNKKEG